MRKNRELSESTITPQSKRKLNESKKIRVSKIKLESRKIFEEEDLDVIDDKFSVDEDNLDNDEVVLVIDPELPPEGEEEDLEVKAEEMIGDKVYKCPVCGANYLCDCDKADNESLELDEEGNPTECPICGDDSEQIYIGVIESDSDQGKDDEEVEMEPQEVEDEEVEVDEEEEVKEESVKSRRPMRPLARRPRMESKRRVKESKLPRRKGLKEGYYDYYYWDPAYRLDGIVVSAYYDPEEDPKDQVFGYVVESDEGRGWEAHIYDETNSGALTAYNDYGFLGEFETEEEAKRSVESFFKSGAKTVEPRKSHKASRDEIIKAVHKYFHDAELEVDPEGMSTADEYVDALKKVILDLSGYSDEEAGDIIVRELWKMSDLAESVKSRRSRTEAKSSCKEGSCEGKGCKEDEAKDKKVRGKRPAKESRDFYFDEKKLESLMNHVIEKNYDGDAPKFKVESIVNSNNKLRIAYVVTEGKKTTKGTLIAEGFRKTLRSSKVTLRVKDRGVFTESYTRTPAFVIECSYGSHKITPKKISYDYKVKVNESLYRVVGKAGFKK